MNRWVSRILLLVLLLSFVSPGAAQPARAAAGTRLVVFEGFYKTT